MKSNFILFLLLNISFHVCAQSDVSTAKWMHVIVDGNSSEWGSLNFYDDQTQLNFGLANDSNYIYLCFATTTEPVEMKMMRAGMKITLSTKGKPRHEASILFPLPQTKQPPHTDSIMNEGSNDNNHPVFNKETFRQNYIAHHTAMQVSGFTTLNGEVPIKDSLIQVAVNWDSASNLIYEIAIAKKEFFGASYTTKESMEDITLSAEINGLSKSELGSEGKTNGYQKTGMQTGGMHDGGGMHGGGMRGGGFNGGGRYGGEARNPMINSNSPSLSTKTSFKQKFVLNNGSN